MIKSLTIKLGMLMVTMALVLWIGWPPPHDPVPPVAEVQASEAERHEIAPPGKQSSTLVERAKPRPAVVPTGTHPHSQKGKLDLNRATAEELQSLPGIGPVLAQRVIEQRTVHGPFRDVDDLMNVKGIGKKRMDQLRPLVTVDLVKKEAKAKAL